MLITQICSMSYYYPDFDKDSKITSTYYNKIEKNCHD